MFKCESADLGKLAGSSGHQNEIEKLWLAANRQVTQVDHVHRHCLRLTLCAPGRRVTSATPELTQERSDERALA